MNPAMRRYYDVRAEEYDEWWQDEGRFTDRDRPGWHEDVAAVCAAVAALPPARTLDLACGTGFLTAHLHGDVTGLDQSAQMLEVARRRLPGAELVQGDALAPPFVPGRFDRVFSGHFYGHLDAGQRAEFVRAAHELAGELVIVDSASRPDRVDEEWEERVLNDGSSHEVYKRRFSAEALADELGGGETLHAGPWFVAVRSR
jgi:demethylmenaquinone methyltransferase/2-methoxy-6-polyprenyl-1,4-benzoquinol methylase